MQIILTGGAGFIGKKLVAAILEQGGLMVDGEMRPLGRIKLLDVVPATGLPADPRLEVVTADLDTPGALERLIDERTDLVIHLAAIVSAGAEADFDLGMRVNLDGTRAVLEACRRLPEPPRFLFASSVAVYGGDVVQGVIADTTHLTPQTSYGVQKAVGELLVMDHHRKGFVDGRSLRLPTIVVRPGKPNKAASTWASSIIREPLAGAEAVCPVTLDTEMYVLSPRGVVQAILDMIDLSSEALGQDRTVMLPGLTVNVTQMLDTLEAVAGPKVRARVRFEPDATIQNIVAGWARRFEPQRARKLGFKPDPDFRSIVEAHIEDELAGRIA